MENNRAFILGVAGGSGSGKTYFVEALQQQLGRDVCRIVYQDSFYFDQSARFDFDGGAVNFDHPSSIDFALLADCLRRLKKRQNVQIPIYDFKTHSRRAGTEAMGHAPLILVDGILIFHEPAVRTLFDDLVYFDAAEDLRLSRRLRRDVEERGRSPEGVRRQFYQQVKPMHDQFVEPSKAHARMIVEDAGEFEFILDIYRRKLKRFAERAP